MFKKDLFKKILKYFLISTPFLGIAAIVVYFSTSWKQLPLISASGSSAIFPLITEYSNIYDESDIVVQAGGSGVGISAALNNTKNFGMASKNPKGLDGDKKQEWIDKRMKTITIAWDGIGIVYKSSSNNDTLNITSNNILKIYQAFAGYESISFNDLDSNNSSKETIKTYAREGGSEKSGTADAFYKDSRLKPSSGILSEVEKKALETGSYGKNTIPTAEANSQAWSSIKDSLDKNTMIYLSAGFILNNKKEILDNGFKIATYNGVELSKDKIANSYNWYRPFNLIVSLKNIDDATKKFINWTITESATRDQILDNLGYIKLDASDTNKVNDWSKSDADLGYCGA